MHTASANVYCELKEQDKVVAAAAAGTPRETKEDLIVEREEYDPASFPRKDRRGEGLDAAWPGRYSAFKGEGTAEPLICPTVVIMVIGHASE